MRPVLTRVFQGLAWLVVASLLVEFYLAGTALFGVATFQPHRLLGVISGVLILLLAILAPIAVSARRVVGQAVLLALLTVLQLALPQLRLAAPAVAALHVVNAALLLGLAAAIARAAASAPTDIRSPEPMATVGASPRD
jgi:hypothetical protein